ncbi:hypothetical protein NQ314_015462 [Rhamnusium bicolor]|uniref:C2H2-type domain-containing protein n=1 Tax=Rhamnusium bicolor TaxID=1586634 RepID=A0AAV8WYB0_9CUCU|nr:hypothetical protein NQ314_015462 [Rhamnusium bicolor]
MIKTNPPIDDSVLFKIDNSTQTTTPEKVEAPYSIEIQDHIVVKEYRANTFDGKKITMKQLINWPYIEIEFISKELKFKRTNVHAFKRYLTFSTEKITFKNTGELIEEVAVINNEIGREAYTLNVMKQYCHMYTNVLEKLQVILIILEDFVLDITEINMNSIATNTSIIFNIGGCIYARNKSVRTSDQAVSFAEFITPKMKFSLFHFKAIKDENSATPFEKLQELNNTTDVNIIRSFLPSIKYNCIYCIKSYSDKSDILKHFKQKHCMEQPVLCYKCKLQLNITALTENRWRHKCINCNSGTQSVPR